MTKPFTILGAVAIVLSMALIYGLLLKPDAEATEPRQFAIFEACGERYPANNDHYLDCVLNGRLN